MYHKYKPIENPWWKVKRELDATVVDWERFGFWKFFRDLPYKPDYDRPDRVGPWDWETWMLQSIELGNRAIADGRSVSATMMAQAKVLLAFATDYTEYLAKLELDQKWTCERLLYHMSRVEEILEYEKQNDSALENPTGYIYLINEHFSDRYKIGRSRRVKQRSEMFRIHLPFEWEFIGIFKVDDAVSEERILHDKFQDKRVKGEWFTLSAADIMYFYDRYCAGQTASAPYLEVAAATDEVE